MGLNKILRLVGAAAALSLIFLASLLPVHAQQNSGELQLTTSPLPISLKAKPGETISTPLRIRNSGNQPETLKVGLMKFSAEGDDGKPKLEDRGANDDYFDWVTFSENQFVAQPGEWKEIKMTIRVPKDAAFGYYYAVTFSRAGKESQNSQETSVKGATATLVLLEVDSNDANPQLELESFTSDKKSYEFLPVTFTVKVKNSGNIHLAPHGTIFIKQGSRTVATIPVNESGGIILPDSSRIFTAQWTDGFPVYRQRLDNDQAILDKNGKPSYGLAWDINQVKNIRFGHYSAHLTLVYDDGQKDVPLDAALGFWVIPWRLLLLFIGLPLVLVGVIVYLLLSRRRYKKKSVYRR